jgi:Tfp pilus assembly PilM family ATPase
MPRLLALEWNETEARVAVASSRAGQIALEHAFSVDLRPEQADAEVQAADVQRRIAAACAARRLTRIPALVAIGHGDVELRRLSLPPAPDDELPDLVRFQATREFNTLGENWPLDFLPIGDDPEQPRTVLAAAASPDLVEKSQATCQAAGLKLSRLVLRPCATASLVSHRQPPKPEQVRLLVELLDDEADLTVTIDQRVVFLRRARLHGDPLSGAEAAEALVSEVRRTIVAAQNQLRGQRVDSIWLCGATPEHVTLADSIRDQFPVSMELLDPFDGLNLEGDLRRGMPDHPDRFAPLLGMLIDELDGVPHAFDLLHPRRPPQAPSYRDKYALAGLAVATLVLLLLGLTWFQSSRLDKEIKRLERELSTASDVSKTLGYDRQVGLDNLLEEVQEKQQVVEEIERWAGTTVGWLDELRWLSEKLPDSQDAMLTQLTLSTGSGKAKMILDGRARSIDAVTKLDTDLQDDSENYFHSLEADRKSEDESKKPYPVDFKSTLSLVPKPEKSKRQPRKGVE